MAGTTYNNLITNLENNNSDSLLWVLLDPDTENPDQLCAAAEMAVENGADALLVGGSYYERDDFDDSVLAVKEGSAGAVPVFLFPGNHRQVSKYADALLFHALISGRNPQYLIGEHLLAAGHVRRLGLETISMGYLLIESGRVTSVQSVTGTTPIPREKTELIATHALAGQYLGMQLIYLEAGSGGLWPVPDEAISLTKETIDVPVIIGGGIRGPESAHAASKAGADVVVVGNVFEQTREPVLIREIAAAVHGSTKKTVAP
ncbi:MAG: geranylgeranylglyceryl/heptaprenylglyceryl phosphate synthase [Candidatus Electryonea clarkiae]|nr:geranylgeranylglyceryl/heptaprenylglyceryl phosphate synthase [Candidatus Electryonea clarkiae]MDP8286667.1 geranylgeranylglyceryl/heptaprenylglyceryl phosphate synthase [Candidatus Electryonea clarkiae]